ncbi:MAG: KEOPS complex subunit Pcc1 [Nanoarchaeota archaeon]
MKATFSVEERLCRIEDRGSGRSRITRKGSVVTVEAKDAVAFRAACNAVLKELVLAEKARLLVRKI